jgi:hypothetical protein
MDRRCEPGTRAENRMKRFVPGGRMVVMAITVEVARATGKDPSAAGRTP